MPGDNVAIVREGWDAWLRGDLDALASLWDPDIVWDTRHFHDWPESSYQGPEGVRRFLTEWLEVWGEYEIEVNEVRAAPDGRVVSLFTHHGKGRQSGVPMDLQMANITTLREGKVIRFDNYSDQHEALAAAGIAD
jgi:uncharacterized protein